MESLKKNKEFKKVYNNGKSYVSRNLVLYVLQTPEKDFNKYGLSVSKKVGNAVVRNKLKRRMREIIREFEKKDFKAYDIVFIARNPAAKLDYQELRRDIKKLFKKANLF